MACVHPDMGELRPPPAAPATPEEDVEAPPELKQLSSIELTDDDWELDVRPPVHTRAPPWWWLARKQPPQPPEPGDVESDKASVISFYEIVTLGGDDDDAFDHHIDDTPSTLGPFAVLQP